MVNSLMLVRGYTPLHLAAQGNHEDIIDVLIGAYKADVSIRDYSGKKAKHYLRNSASAIKLFNIEEEKKVLLDKEVKEAVKNVGDPKYQNITSLLGSQGSNIRASFRAYRTQIHNRRNSNNSPTLSPKLKKCKEPGSSSETGKKRKDSKKGKEMFGFGVPTTSRVKSESDMNKKSFFI
ncbi:ankyrin repeat domain-containing protein SOWAHB-like [Tubulanus polymorphus]|uniref:ankyrin repeat domain-containing protein SOWAHB-like n=1 Tax=Tubulanus polymorphus TaxID=672921 RepID=UPI003DA58968